MAVDIEQARVRYVQMRLFPIRPRQVCQSIKLNWMAALHLRDTGWLSFDPESAAQLDDAQEAELVLLGSLVVAGFDNAMLEYLLRDLKKPYQYRLERMYYDWLSQRWCLLPQLHDIDREEFLREWLDELVQQEDDRQIKQIEQLAQAALHLLHQAETASEVADDEEDIPSTSEMRTPRRPRLRKA